MGVLGGYDDINGTIYALDRGRLVATMTGFVLHFQHTSDRACLCLFMLLTPSCGRAAIFLSLGNVIDVGSKNLPVIYYQMTVCGERLAR